MFDPITLGVGGVLVASGWIVGRHHRHPKATDAPEPVCRCTHGLDQHDPETNRCHAQIQRVRRDGNHEKSGYEYVPCTCRQYIGPKPVEAFYATPMVLPTDN